MEQRDNNGRYIKGIIWSQEQKDKISKSMQGKRPQNSINWHPSYGMKNKTPWNKGLTKNIDLRIKKLSEKKGITLKRKYAEGKIKIWNKGLTAETSEGVKRIALSKIGKKHNFIHPFKGKKFSKEHREKISIGHKGQIPWIKGKKHTLTARLKMSIARKGQTVWNKGKKCPQFSKENHPQWKGGISNSPYSFEFNDKLKEKIRKRDNYQCQNKECNMTEEEHLIVYGKILLIHHIDYDKNNSNENNLITLCLQCNSRVNWNRIYWQNYFKQNEVIKNGIFS